MYSPNGNAYQYQPSSNRRSVRLDSSEIDDDGGGGGSRQPLYANAPPKPKRLNTSRDRDSPSPDRLVYQVNEEQTATPLVTAMYQQPNSGKEVKLELKLKFKLELKFELKLGAKWEFKCELKFGFKLELKFEL
jgi:hypothetical protein